MVKFATVLAALEGTDFPKRQSTYHSSRTSGVTTTSDKSTRDDSKIGVAVGVVKCQSKGIVVAKATRQHLDLVRLLVDFARAHTPEDFYFTSIQINKNNQTSIHTDSNNTGDSYIVGLGDYEGGDFWVCGSGRHSCKGRWVRFDGNEPHCTLPFRGTRYTIVYYLQQSWRKLQPRFAAEAAALNLRFPPRDSAVQKRRYLPSKVRVEIGKCAFAMRPIRSRPTALPRVAAARPVHMVRSLDDYPEVGGTRENGALVAASRRRQWCAFVAPQAAALGDELPDIVQTCIAAAAEQRSPIGGLAARRGPQWSGVRPVVGLEPGLLVVAPRTKVRFVPQFHGALRMLDFQLQCLSMHGCMVGVGVRHPPIPHGTAPPPQDLVALRTKWRTYAESLRTLPGGHVLLDPSEALLLAAAATRHVVSTDNLKK